MRWLAIRDLMWLPARSSPPPLAQYSVGNVRHSFIKGQPTCRLYCTTSVGAMLETNKLFANVELFPEEARGTADVPLDLSRWPQMKAHFPDKPIFPAVMTIHAMVHLATLVEASLNHEPKFHCFSSASLSRIVRASFRHLVLPSHHTLHLAVHCTHQRPQSLQPVFHGVATLPCLENCPVAAEAQFILQS